MSSFRLILKDSKEGRRFLRRRIWERRWNNGLKEMCVATVGGVVGAGCAALLHMWIS